MQKLITLDQARGMLIGLAVGDALGTTLEFKQRESFAPIAEIVGGGPFNLQAGKWTDDTSMALCLGHSLQALGRWDPTDVMQRFVKWRDHGYLSSTGTCFDIGIQTTQALDQFLRTGDPYAGPVEESKSGNGGIMRLAPIVIAYAGNADRAVHMAQQQSRLTHASPQCLNIASDMARFLINGDLATIPVTLDPPREASGYVMHTIEAAYWAMRQGDNFRDVLLAGVNLGGDADTVGAVIGQLAGRYFGYSGIPSPWLDILFDHRAILTLADALYAMQPKEI